ncbi:hypothetical protein D3C79_874620 [compost metagenome]
MRSQSDNLEAQLLSDKEDRTEYMIAGRLAERIVQNNGAVQLHVSFDILPPFGDIIEQAEEQRHILAPLLPARPAVGLLPGIRSLRNLMIIHHLSAGNLHRLTL